MSKSTFKKIQPYLFETLFYVAIFLFSVLSYVIFTPLFNGTTAVGRGEAAKCYAIFLLILIALALVLLLKFKKLSRKRLIFLMILASFVIRLGYMLYTEGNARQYDTWSDDGHFGYAKILFETGKLPTNNNYQFYHPPLNAFIQSKFMAFFRGLFTFLNKYSLYLSSGSGLETTTEAYYSACQTLSVLYVTIIAVTSCKIFKRLNIKGAGEIVGLCFVLFFPRFVQFSAQLNNDVLCTMFSFLAVYWAIKFYQEQSYKNIVVLGFMIGLGMMTKLNCALICLPIALLMLILLVKRIKTKKAENIVDIVAKYVVFLFVCAPLGLWFQIYAKVRFDQNLGYVFPYLNGELSTAAVPFYRRFLLPSLKGVLSSPFANAWEDYNLWDYMIKSSMFGEFSYWNGTAFAFVAVILNYFFQVAFVVTFIFWILHNKFEKKKIFNLKFIVFFSIFLTFILGQIYFYIKMPYGCTMDFRYVVPLVLGYGGLVATFVQDAAKTHLKGFKTAAVIMAFFAVALVFSTSVFYLVCV